MSSHNQCPTGGGNLWNHLKNMGKHVKIAENMGKHVETWETGENMGSHVSWSAHKQCLTGSNSFCNSTKRRPEMIVLGQDKTKG